MGVSFGADRIYDVMTQLGLFQQTDSSSTEVLVLNFGGNEINYALRITNHLRSLGIRSELYPDQVKLKKQISYAGSKKIPVIIIAGEEEIRDNEVTYKIMATGEQKKIRFKDIESHILQKMKGGH